MRKLLLSLLAIMILLAGLSYADVYKYNPFTGKQDNTGAGYPLSGELVNKAWELAIPHPTALLDATNEVSAMCNYQGNMYIGYDNSNSSANSTASLYKWDGKTNTAYYEIGRGPDFQHVNSCTEYNGKLFIASAGQSAGQGRVFVYDPLKTPYNFLQFKTANLSNTDYVSVPNDSSNNAIFGSTAFSFAYYGRVDDITSSASNFGTIIFKRNAGGTAGYAMSFTTSNALTVSIRESGGTRTTTTNTSAFTTGAKHWFVFSWTSGAAPKIYVDGVESSYASTTAATTPVDDTAVSLLFGNNIAHNRIFGGTFEQVLIWRGYAVTGADAASLVAGGSAASSPTGKYLFTEGTGTTIADASGNGNTATINGATNPYWNNTLFDISFANGVHQYIYSLKKFRGKLYAGTGFVAPALIYAFDGTSWSTSYSGLATYSLNNDMFVYKGRLFASLSGTSVGAIVSTSDGITWTTEISGVAGSSGFTRFTEFKGKLYAAHFNSTNEAYVRDDASGTWSPIFNFTSAGNNQCWGMANYNNALYIGCSNTTVSGFPGYIFKSYDGLTYTLDLAVSSTSAATIPTEVFVMNNYNGSLYAGMGFHTGNADVWRKTDSLGQLTDNIDRFIRRFYGNINQSVNWSEDDAIVNVTPPWNFKSLVGFDNNGINWDNISNIPTSGINWNSITGTPGQVLTLTPTGVNWNSLSAGGGSGTVTSFALTPANGFTGSVANSTTTPALTLNNINWNAAVPVPSYGINWNSIPNYSTGKVLSPIVATSGVNWSDLTSLGIGDMFKATYDAAAITQQLVGTTATQTLTNKRLTKRIVTAADATSITPNSDNADIIYQLNTQALGTLTINADAGSPTNGQSLVIKIKSTNVQTFSWNAVFVGGTAALPTVTSGGSKIDYYCFIYDTVNSKWQYTGTATGF